MIHDKELLSVIRGLEEWTHVLEGAKHMIELLNDHMNLMYFQTSQNLNSWQAHWRPSKVIVRASGYAARYAGVPSAAFDCLDASLDTLSPYCMVMASLR